MDSKHVRTALEFKHLRTVVAVAEAGSITKAAKLLYVAQPALSTQLHQLEHTLGVALFVRTPKGMQLTEAGEQFLIHAKSILKYTDHAVEELMSKPNDVSGDFTIGCANSLADSVGATLMKKLKHRFPKIRPSIQTIGGVALQQSVVADVDFCITYANVFLRAANGDIAYTAENVRIGSAVVEKVAVERFLVCMPEDYNIDLDSKNKIIQNEVSLEMLESAPICLFANDQAATKIIEWLADAHDLNIDYYGFTNSTHIMLDLVLSGKCITLLTSSFVEFSKNYPNIKALPLQGYQIEREIVLCYPNDLEVSDNTRLVMGLTGEILRSTLSR